MKNDYEWANALKMYRATLGVSQPELAALIGPDMPTKTIQQWEQAQRHPPAFVQSLVMEKLDYLVGEQDKKVRRKQRREAVSVLRLD